MNKIIRTISVLLTCFFLTACVGQTVSPPFEPVDLSQKYGTMYQSKVDQFLVIYDASASMFLDYNKEMKFKQARRVMEEMNVTLPDINVLGGIRAFGPEPYTMIQKDPLLYGMTKYVRDDFANALHTVTTTGGATPLAQVISLASEDLGTTGGKAALIIVSDAEDVGQAEVEAAKTVKDEFKDQLCIYTILIGDAPGSKEVMAAIADAGGCGFATDYETVNSPEGMADFVEKVFIEKVDRDSDGDGVLDSVDRCPNTPKGDKVDQYGCTIVPPAPAPKMDSDMDGVFDDLDLCPGTPLGIKVDKDGCPLPIIKKTSIELRIEFDFDKYFIRPEYHQTLKEFADFMNDYPNLVVTIEGHTDNSGSAQYNRTLSQKRAERVSQYLTTYFNVDARRLQAKGYGESEPETTNDTEAGKQQNRRVLAVIDVGK